MDKLKARSVKKSVKELEKILKLGAKFGVSELFFEGVHIYFSPESNLDRRPRKAKKLFPQNGQSVPYPDVGLIDSLIVDRKSDIKEILETSHIEDPLAYEDAISSGELIEERTQDS